MEADLTGAQLDGHGGEAMSGRVEATAELRFVVDCEHARAGDGVCSGIQAVSIWPDEHVCQ
jgi:hypothetical protein